ncbi:MAG: hypothetical protein GY799_15650 [Desulfobulbaceae bacterium]|nr:hypothetical protein [Desulfobulbaceae bacterium]
MNSLKTLYFPGTDIYSIRQYPIFLLFQKIHLIKPVEEDPKGSGEESTDTFIKSGFCQVHTPCPLEENRHRFLRLVEDIKNRKDDYAAQLSSLILASKSAPSTVEADSEQSIISSIFTPKDLQANSLQVEKEEKLWQARLVLVIGEILDQEEEEIARNLAMLDDDQAGLFKELHGDVEAIEEDNPFAELSQLESNLNAASSGNIKKRFNGWKTLFLEDDAREYDVFLTSSQDAGDLLLESYEKKTNLSAPLVAGLELPGLIGWSSEEASQTVVTFSENNSALLSEIHEILRDVSQKELFTEKEIQSNNMLAAISEQWNTELETVFPAKQYGRISVKWYLFPNIACSTLIGKTLPATAKRKNGLLVVVD